jgi:hypothetical protein
MDNRVVDCHSELKRLRDLQYESDFNDDQKQSDLYRKKAEYIQSLINQGVEYIPNF